MKGGQCGIKNAGYNNSCWYLDFLIKCFKWWTCKI